MTETKRRWMTKDYWLDVVERVGRTLPQAALAGWTASAAATNRSMDFDNLFTMATLKGTISGAVLALLMALVAGGKGDKDDASFVK